jgi:hypothetical protein
VSDLLRGRPIWFGGPPGAHRHAGRWAVGYERAAPSRPAILRALWPAAGCLGCELNCCAM